MFRSKNLRVVDFTWLIATLLTAVGGCPVLTGCATMAKMTPGQYQAIDSVSAALSKAARENNVTGYARIELNPVELYAKQSFGVQGIEGEVFLFANPAASNACETTGTTVP